jgi:hypothetical protein
MNSEMVSGGFFPGGKARPGRDANQSSPYSTVTYRGFYLRWKFISVPKTQHTTDKYNQPFSKHTSGFYTQRCPTQDSLYRTSSGNLPTRTHILAVRKSPNTRAFLEISQTKSSNQQPNTHTRVYTRRFPNTDWLQINRSPQNNNLVTIETSPCLLLLA